ncbi:MAG: xanthine dehydrogenase family protein subunit M [Chloroflexaceae bacterium]|nr:xanthine dehydrogenase family protein subunit M [Chloroflexaceae bacterium]NJO07233.1 xanthine dehydrogenase family protein subunit M [Chloroflexaceae bacterium]
MRPGKFAYHRAETIDAALELLTNNEDAKVLAGGHSLIPALNLRLAQPEMLIDIGRLENLRGIQANGSLMIGALTTHAQIETSAAVQQYCRALSAAVSKVGDPMVRNRGTIGGNIAHADPASDPPTVLLACDSIIHLQGPDGTRTVPVQDFFLDLFTTDVQPNELVTGIEVPNMSDHKTAYAKLTHPASHYAVVGVCVAVKMDGDTCDHAHVAIGGALPKAMRSPGAEAALAGTTLDDAALNAAAEALMDEIRAEVMGDVYAPEAYRTAMAGVYLKRAIRQALAS